MDFFQQLGVAFVMCALVWTVLPKAGLAGRASGLLYAKLVGAFMALHYAGAAVYPGGFNVVVTTLITCAVARLVWLPRRPVK